MSRTGETGTYSENFALVLFVKVVIFNAYNLLVLKQLLILRWQGITGFVALLIPVLVSRPFTKYYVRESG